MQQTQNCTGRFTGSSKSEIAVRSLAPKSMQQKVLVYARVSTESQDESSQVEMGRQLARELGYVEDQIMVIVDHGVSARKVKMRERLGLVKAMNHAAAGDVAMMIVRDRDRIARNMVEYLEIWQKLGDVGVSLVLSDPGATPVSDNFGEEAWNALMAEIEGDTIASRTKAVSRFYPPAPFGYEKIGRKGNTRYEFTEDINNVKDLFDAFQAVRSKEEYVQLRGYWRKRIGRYPEKILQNLMYAAAIPDGDSVRPLRHVTPIAAVATVLENQRQLKQWGFGVGDNTPAEPLRVFVPLVCNRCDADLEERIRKGERTFSCPTCRKVRYTESVLFDVISQTIQDIVSNLNESDIRGRVLSAIRMHRNYQMNEIRKLFEKRSQTGRNMLDAMELGSIDKFMDEYQALETALQEAFREVRRLENLAVNVEELNQAVTAKLRYTAECCSEPIQKLLIHRVSLNVGVVTVYHRFADLANEEEIV